MNRQTGHGGVQHIPARVIAQHNPGAVCCDCEKEAAEAGAQVWTFLAGNARCPKCSEYEGLY